jgi:hypothetical protein
MFVSWRLNNSYQPEDGLIIIIAGFVFIISSVGLVGSFLITKHPAWTGTLQFIVGVIGFLFFPFWIPAGLLLITGSIFAWKSI